MADFEIKAGLRLRVPLEFLDDNDNPEAVQNPGATSSDETVATPEIVDSTDPTRPAGAKDLLVHRSGVGPAVITVTADADLSEAISPISNLLTVFCSPVQATKVKFGQATTEPDVNLSPENAADAIAASGADATVGLAAVKTDPPAEIPPAETAI